MVKLTSAFRMLKQGVDTVAVISLGAFPAASRVDPGLTQVIRDQLCGFERVAARRVHNQLSGRHLRPIEGAVFVELAELVYIAELAESPARFGGEAGLELGLVAAQLNESKSPAAGRDAILERRDEFVRDRRFRGERHDHARLFRHNAGIDGVEPQPLTERDKGRRSEGEERDHQIHNCVVVEEAVARIGREQLTDCELADARTAAKEDDLSAHASAMLSAGNVNVSFQCSRLPSLAPKMLE